MLTRGLRRRCPWCGGRGAFFTSWFGKRAHCSSCGLRWRRGDVGFELGALSIAAMLVLGPLILLLATVLAITWPVIPVVPLLAVLLPVALVLPIVAYPVSYTVWQALDLTFREVDPGDFDAAHIVHGLLDDS
jgi:uncharacterized protein (DUF983 family)